MIITPLIHDIIAFSMANLSFPGKASNLLALAVLWRPYIMLLPTLKLKSFGLVIFFTNSAYIPHNPPHFTATSTVLDILLMMMFPLMYQNTFEIDCHFVR